METSAVGQRGVLVVDDDQPFRAFVRQLLERAGFAVEEAADADEALAAVERRRPRLVLLDVVLPQTSGYEIYRELRDRCGDDLPIIFVSGRRTDSYDRVAGLQLGADDYLLKPFEPDELVARVRRSLRTSDLASGVNGDHGADGAAIDGLTPREREVLVLLARGRGTGQIARDLVISPRTLGTHVQHILTKLGVHSRTQAVAVAHQAGILASSSHGSNGEPR